MDDDEVAAILGGSRRYNAAPTRAPCPKPGENREFDRYFAQTTEDVDPEETDMNELRRAAWATWKVQPPANMGRGNPADDQEDDELARVLALSAQEHASSSTRPSPRPVVVDDDDDDELQRAIALSQQEAREPKRMKRAETPEEERRMIAEAMAASLAESEAGPSTSTTPMKDSNKPQLSIPIMTSVSPSAEPSPAPSVDSAGSGVLRVGGQVLDRAQLEKERRERQAARQANQGQTNGTTGSSGLDPSMLNGASAGPSRIAGMSSLNPSSRQATSNPAASTSASSRSSSLPTASIHPFQAPGPFSTDAGGEYYLDGEMRHVALTIGQPTTERTFSPQQIIGNHSQISLVIMSSFCIDDQWIGENEILPSPDVVPTIVIRPHPKDKPECNGRAQLQVNGEVWVYPKMTGEWGNSSAHMKYFWILYKTGRLRVVILTANMVPYDWEWIENTVFVQDFLPLPSPIAFLPNHLPHDFPAQFRTLFGHLKVHIALKTLIKDHPYGSRITLNPEDGFESLTRWDWSRVRVRIIMSIPSEASKPFVGAAAEQYGMCRLGRVLREEGWVAKAGEKVVAEYQGSSLGQYSIDWYDKFYQFCCGKTVPNLIGRPKPTSWPSMKVLFPSLATVDNSILGRGGGGTMFASKSFNGATKNLFYDSNSKRGGVLMHAKVLVALFEPAYDHLGFSSASKNGSERGKRKASEMDNEEKGVGGWMYVGSHNFSSAAWGTLDVKKSPPGLTVRNYELGIVFPLDRKNASATADKVAPYRRPARKYSPTDVPWDQKQHLPPA